VHHIKMLKCITWVIFILYTRHMQLLPKTKYTFTAVGYILYFSMLALLLTTMLTRHNQTIWHGIGSHLSNFALSALLMFISGATNVLNKASLRYILTCAGILVVANFAVESFTSSLNVKDFADAFYGCAGILTALVSLLALHRYGIRPTKP